ncbi:hypothetical protein [Kitasatospora sp. NPDC017646]|uniref:hypothetical protein n=1 Tax=Kitasatospora sp. NPDC017646 TaxID=3364024 RepID=UPI00378A8AA9
MTDRLLPAKGQRVITELDRKGNVIVRVQTVKSREFESGYGSLGDPVLGYVTDARIMLEVLGSLRAPGGWFQTWCKVLSLQRMGSGTPKRPNTPGYVRTTQRDLQSRAGLSPATVSEAMQYFSSLPWVRPAGRGLLQLNPFLTVAIGSGDHERVQQEWLDAVGDTFLLPGPDHPAEWREIRAAAKDEAKKAKQAAVGENVVPIKRVSGRTAQPKRSAAV